MPRRSMHERIVGEVYDATVGAKSWTEALSSLCQGVDGHTALFATLQTSPTSMSVVSAAVIGFCGVSDELCNLYLERHLDNPLSRAGARLPPGVSMPSQAFCPIETLIPTLFFDEFLRPSDLLHLVGGNVVYGSNRIVAINVMRSARGGPFDDVAASVIRRLYPHLTRAAQIRQRLDDIDLQRASAAESLNRLDTGLVLVDRHGRVIFVNGVAQTILDQRDGLVVERGTLRGDTSTVTSTLHRVLGLATLTGERKGVDPGGTLALPRPSGKRPLSVIVAPLGDHGLDVGSSRPAAMVFVTDPEREVEAPVETLARLYGLTPAEASYAEVLVRGTGLAEAADQLGVSMNTARTHLKRVFMKTGTRRQAELVRLLLSGVPQAVRDNGEKRRGSRLAHLEGPGRA